MNEKSPNARPSLGHDATEESSQRRPIDVQLDVGEELTRFRTRWWQLWYVHSVRVECHISHHAPFRIPRNPPPPPPSSLADATVYKTAFFDYDSSKLIFTPGYPDRDRVFIVAINIYVDYPFDGGFTVNLSSFY